MFSDSIHLDSDLLRKSKELELILKLNKSVVETLDLQEVMQIISDGMSELLQIETAAIYLLQNKNNLYLGATTPHLDSKMPDELRHARLDHHPNIGIAVSSRRAHIMEDTKTCELTPQEEVVVKARGLRSSIYLPFVDKEMVSGVLIMSTINQKRRFSDEEIELCEGVCNQLNLGLQNASMHSELLNRNEELEKIIQEKEKTEEALSRSENMLATAMRITKSGHWEYSIKEDEFTFTDEFYALMKTSVEEMGTYKMSSGEYRKRFLFPEDIQIIGNELKKVLDAGDPNFYKKIEHRIRYANGEEGFVSVNTRLRLNNKGEPEYVYGSNQDITEHKRIEQEIKQSKIELEKSEYLFRSLFDQAAEGIFIITLDGSRIIQANKSLAQMHGYTLEEILSMNLFDLDIHGKDAIKLREVEMSQLLNNEVVELEVQHRHKDGHIIPLTVISQKLQLKEEEFLLCFHQDLTERKRTEVELRKALDKAKESDRLKSAFLANISHEIRTPLNAILGFSQFLYKEDLDSVVKKDYLDIINSSGKRLLDIISDILDISKIESGQLKINIENVDLTKLLNLLIVQNSKEAEEQNNILSLAPGLELEECYIMADELRLSQVLNNLISNAIKFTHHGSIIVSYEKLDGFMRFVVKDSGIGIDKEHQIMIFERFSQVDNEHSRAGSGNGLGLSIAKGIVELLGGEMYVDSEPGLGSSFYFTIPYNPVNTIKESKIIEIKKSMKEKAFKILIAEDELSNFLYLEALLEGYDCEIVHARNGKEALEYFQSTNPDLVLMDIKMPILNGLEATREIRKSKSEVPIIAQTAYAMDEDKQKALEAGCDYYLTKPIEQGRFDEILKESLARKES